MPHQKTVTLRCMREDELPMVKQWAKAEGWNPGQNDFEFYYAAYPQAFYILEVDSETEKKPVGCTTIMRYSQNYAFLGLLIVIPEERKHGYGQIIWDKTMELLKDCETIRFYGVLPRKRFYRPYNFFPIAYNSAYGTSGDRITKVVEKLSHFQPQAPCFFKPPTSSNTKAMTSYEDAFLHIRRKEFIAAFIGKNQNNALLAVDKEGRILGYGAITPCTQKDTFAVRPLYADKYKIAKALLLELLRHLESVSPQTHIKLDIPLSNPKHERLTVDFDLDHGYIDDNKECDTAVMSHSPEIAEEESKDLDVSKIYSRFSLEFS